MKYELLEIEVVEFQAEDILTLSIGENPDKDFNDLFNA